MQKKTWIADLYLLNLGLRRVFCIRHPHLFHSRRTSGIHTAGFPDSAVVDLGRIRGPGHCRFETQKLNVSGIHATDILQIGHGTGASSTGFPIA